MKYSGSDNIMTESGCFQNKPILKSSDEGSAEDWDNTKIPFLFLRYSFIIFFGFFNSIQKSKVSQKNIINKNFLNHIFLFFINQQRLELCCQSGCAISSSRFRIKFGLKTRIKICLQYTLFILYKISNRFRQNIYR